MSTSTMQLAIDTSARTWMTPLAYALLAYWLVAASGAALALTLARPGHARVSSVLGRPLSALAELIAGAATRGKLHSTTPATSASAVAAAWSAAAAARVPTSSVTVPHAWFAHFYVVGAAVTLATVAALLLVPGPDSVRVINDDDDDPDAAASTRWISQGAHVLPLVLFAVHVARRLWESVFVFKASDARMSALGYCAGISYYVMMPPALCIDRLGITTGTIVDGARVGSDVDLGGLSPMLYPPARVLARAPQLAAVAIGVAIFAYGSRVQHRCHRHLASLRRRRTGMKVDADANDSSNGAKTSCVASGSSGGGQRLGGSRYALPHEGWFRRIACPHYTAEIIVYIGLMATVASTTPRLDSVAALAPAVETRIRAATILALAFTFVVCNLCVTGRATLVWYRRRFMSRAPPASSSPPPPPPEHSEPHMRYAVLPFLM